MVVVVQLVHAHTPCIPTIQGISLFGAGEPERERRRCCWKRRGMGRPNDAVTPRTDERMPKFRETTT